MTPVCFLVEPRNVLLEHMLIVDPKVHTKMSDRNIIGFIRHGAENIYMFAGGAAFLFGGITVTIIFLSTFGCYNHLRKRKDLFSSRTMSLYWALITALVIDMFSGAILVLMPSCFVGLSFLYGAKHASILTSIAMRSICLYHIMANVVLICAVRPYRDAVSRLFIQILSCKKSSITSRSNKVFDRPSRPTSAQPQIVGFEGNSRFFNYAQ
ncbi:serpentine type 7TM GPCR chemoreceptor srh domain-containing protein [Ditylenchus destructor]|uniref:Serpentine type 7TM GPCR chemoreceptor srh domain-containing protein n=1 Tax=Ditylenchus destructor TaxID=166010 RepID=A0AAD4NG96_9BILA|nr:serpentine type 7TM GPCR chemoreceptor srh domain-containing protein [Ditylenchus destructor]